MRHTAPFALALLLALAGCSDSSNSTPKKPADTPTYTPPPPEQKQPLTQADIDKFVVLQLAFAKSKGDPKVLEAHSITQEEFGKLYKRVNDAHMALKRNESIQEAIPPALQADVELIKANRAKIDAAKEGKAIK
jgi:hypothetical protein